MAFPRASWSVFSVRMRCQNGGHSIGHRGEGGAGAFYAQCGVALSCRAASVVALLDGLVFQQEEAPCRRGIFQVSDVAKANWDRADDHQVGGAHEGAVAATALLVQRREGRDGDGLDVQQTGDAPVRILLAEDAAGHPVARLVKQIEDAGAPAPSSDDMQMSS